MLVLTAVATFLPPSLGEFLLYLPEVAINVCTLPFHVLEFSTGVIREIPFSAPSVALYYATVIIASDKLNLPKWHRRALVLLYILAFAVTLMSG